MAGKSLGTGSFRKSNSRANTFGSHSQARRFRFGVRCIFLNCLKNRLRVEKRIDPVTRTKAQVFQMETANTGPNFYFGWISVKYEKPENPFFVFLRYAVGDSNINDVNYDKLNQDSIPDIILVKKFYGHDKSARRRARMWKLKRLAEDVVSLSTENKYVFFLFYSNKLFQTISKAKLKIP